MTLLIMALSKLLREFVFLIPQILDSAGLHICFQKCIIPLGTQKVTNYTLSNDFYLISFGLFMLETSNKTTTTKLTEVIDPDHLGR